MLICSMNCSLKWYFPLLLCILPFVSNGQNGSLMPDVYGQFFQNYYLINPANSDTSSLVLHLGHKSNLGVFRGVRKTYFD